MSMVSEIQAGIIQAIADAGVPLPVYDNVPSTATHPYITIGPVDGLPDDADCISARRVDVQVDIWGRDNGAKQPTEARVDLVYNALHEASLTLDAPYACVNCRVSQFRVLRQPDGIGAHGILTVSVLAEDQS